MADKYCYCFYCSVFADDIVIGDNLYKVQAWTKLTTDKTDGKSDEDYESIEMWLRWKRKGRTAREEMKMLGARGKFLKSELLYRNTYNNFTICTINSLFLKFQNVVFDFLLFYKKPFYKQRSASKGQLFSSP